MKKQWVILWCLSLGLSLQARGQGGWFTVMGDPADATVDTVEVDPVPLIAHQDLRTMRVRVHRAVQRTNWDGVPYRSYESQVLFDCTHRSARYVSITYYMQPAWKGQAHKTVIYTRLDPRWMEFRDIQPNPHARIVRAACQSMGAATP